MTTTLGVQATGEVFAAAHSQSAITGYFTGSHDFWLGLLIGLAAVILAGWIRLLTAIVAVFELGWVHVVGHHVSFSPRSRALGGRRSDRPCSRIVVGADAGAQATGRIRLPNPFH